MSEITPNDLNERLDMAAGHHRDGRAAVAKQIYEAVQGIPCWPQQAAAFYLYGALAWESGAYQAARVALRKALGIVRPEHLAWETDRISRGLGEKPYREALASIWDATYGVWCEKTFPVPRVRLETVGPCNRSCPYCPVSQYARREGRLSEALVLDIADQLGDLSYDGTIVFSLFNEPLLDKRLLNDFLPYLARKVPNAWPRIFTNGDPLTEDMTNLLFEAGLGDLIVSCHDRAAYARARRIKAALPADRRTRMMLSPYFKAGDGSGAVSLNTRTDTVSLAGYADDRIHPATPYGCGAISFSIDYKAQVHPCCNDFLDGYVVGNAGERSLVAIWEAARDSFRAHFIGDFPTTVCHACVG